MTILVTGAAGFIGSNFVMDWWNQSDESIISLDALTYAGNLENLSALPKGSPHTFIKGNINDRKLVSELLNKHNIRAVIHFAAESHVDRSIEGPSEFIQTNILGTYSLLESVREFWMRLDNQKKFDFRFLHISTDEVYGSLESNQAAFTESHPYQPNSPYSASKASSDFLVRSWFHTYGLPVLTTNCSNNYGPYHFPEKLIPLAIINALKGKPIPIYGNGQQIRDWLFVKDHCDAIRCVLDRGLIGETYNIGGWNEKTNLEVVTKICELLDELRPKKDKTSYKNQITFVSDRPGHDKRYAINANKIKAMLGWEPKEQFETGILKTIQWYLENETWLDHVFTGEYRNWIERHY
jgi:dTDP-glucose 4,6-dehydratase